MYNVHLIPTSTLQKSYKSIINTVKRKKHAVVLTIHEKPQAAIVSLEDLELVQKAKSRQAALNLLQLASEHKEELAHLPSDLRKQANTLLYGK